MTTNFTPEVAEERVRLAARASLERNFEKIGDKVFVTAGRRQFRSFWSRDFCYAVPGLLKLGHDRIVRDQLDLLLAHRRQEDALIPRTLDSTAAQWRVVRQVLLGTFGIEKDLPVGKSLRPEYVGENGTVAIDSNFLALLSARRYVAFTGDTAWWRKTEEEWVQVFRFYRSYRDGILIRQPAFSDWQDSARRDGHVFLTHLFYWKVLTELAPIKKFSIPEDEPRALRQELQRRFLDSESGLYLAWEGHPQIGLDGALLAIDLGFVDEDEARALYERLVQHPVWKNSALPGCPTYPHYPTRDISWTTRVVGLRHYHDGLVWSWLTGLALKVSRIMGDRVRAEAILIGLARLIERDGLVAEVYRPGQGLERWHSPLLKSEMPFSWGAGCIADAL